MNAGKVTAMNSTRVSVVLDNGQVVIAHNALNHRNAPNSKVLVIRADDGSYNVVGRPK